MRTDTLLQQAWQRRGPLALALWPLAQLFGMLAALRRGLYRWGWKRAGRVPVPVLVVGNVVAGGSGKTPVVLAVVTHLQQRGLPVAVLSRGHGRTTRDCREVGPDSLASEVGDEPLLLHRRTSAPVFVAARRLDAARAALQRHPATRILVCDDGLQHLALQRDIAVCVFGDGGLGNGWLLPAGPLREPWPRPADLVVVGATPVPDTRGAWPVQRQLATEAVDAQGRRTPLAALRGQPLHALAGIAQPERFFAMLRDQGLHLAHTDGLPDHFDFSQWPDLATEARLVCTEKDAVKLWRHRPDALAVPLQLTLPDGFWSCLDALVDAKLSSPHGHKTA